MMAVVVSLMVCQNVYTGAYFNTGFGKWHRKYQISVIFFWSKDIHADHGISSFLASTNYNIESNQTQKAFRHIPICVENVCGPLWRINAWYKENIPTIHLH